MFEIRRAEAAELGTVERLLSLCAGPYRDVREGSPHFFVAASETGIIGCSGLQSLGDGLGLVRALVVMPGFRKQQVGRQLFLRLLAHAEEIGVSDIYLLTEGARDYFRHLGFSAGCRECAPAVVREANFVRRFTSPTAVLMHRPLHAEPDGADFLAGPVGRAAKFHFDNGYYCSESVLMAVADHLGLDSPLLPAIATGFSHGVARTWGTCGAVSGAIMGISLASGRRSPQEPAHEVQDGVRSLIRQFAEHCGSTHCSELLACDLDTREGQRLYQENHLRMQCRDFVGLAARLATQIIHDEQPKAGRADIPGDARVAALRSGQQAA